MIQNHELGSESFFEMLMVVTIQNVHCQFEPFQSQANQITPNQATLGCNCSTARGT